MDKIIIIGCGKMGYSLAKYLEKQGNYIIGLTDIHKPHKHISGYNKKYLGTDDEILKYSTNEVKLVMALSEMYMQKRAEIFNEFKSKGYRFKTVIFKGSIISKSTKIGEGCIIFSSVNINSFVELGNIVSVNSNASIDHDCIIGNNVQISPGVTIAGSVTIEDNVMIGSGATIIPTKLIGINSKVGAGAVVLKDVPSNVIVVGIPAKIKKRLNG